MKRIERTLVGLGLLILAGLLLPLASAQTIKKVLTDVKAECANKEFFETTADGQCKAKPGALKALTSAQCALPGMAFVTLPAPGKSECVLNESQPPTPICPATEPPSTFDKSLKQCVVTDDRPRSALGNYVGDCFRIRALPRPSPTGQLQSGSTYLVVSQRPEGESDKLLRLAETEDFGLLNPNARFNCRSKVNGLEFDVKASDLIAVGAGRSGWTYGVLALPYKFHTDDRSFGSGVSIGPYFGRRWGVPGSAYTFAVAATIGTVKGEVRDAQDKITSTPDLQAFSLALGWMYDIAKGADTRPFKIGFFVGADAVGADSVVKYKHNRKPWVALQIGFDFTDN